jgi:hypothetical protein
MKTLFETREATEGDRWRFREGSGVYGVSGVVAAVESRGKGRRTSGEVWFQRVRSMSSGRVEIKERRRLLQV